MNWSTTTSQSESRTHPCHVRIVERVWCNNYTVIKIIIGVLFFLLLLRIINVIKTMYLIFILMLDPVYTW